jgi:putative nucleotidyltransferase with HDIG domain
MTSSPAPLNRILVIDDETEIVAFIKELLTHRGYEVFGLSDSREALSVFKSFLPDVCILDFRMPFLSGSIILDQVKEADPTVEVIFLTAQDETSLAVDLMKRGAIDFLLKPVELNQLSLSVSRAMEHRRLVKENEAYRSHLEKLVADALSMALDFRDQSTSGHSRRVADLTAGAAKAMGADGASLVQIEHGALLHDIGKLKIPDSILWKPGKLDDDEWKTMRRHAEYGYEFLRNLEWLSDAADLVYCHHEKFDGSGYPRGLRGEDIPYGARVFAIVDTIDAMIYQRPYNRPVTFKVAAEEVRRCSGTQFDPTMIEPTLAFLETQIPKELLG